MSITAAELILYSAASMPTDDVSTSGGAISTTSRPSIAQPAAADTVQVLSDGADTRTVTITGRLASGVSASETLTLNGVTAVTSTNTYERVLSVHLSATDASRTLTVRRTTGAVTICTIGPTEQDSVTFFRNSASAAGASTRYEKAFYKNTDAGLALLSAQVTLTAEPTSKIQIGLATAAGDTVSVANRVTAPASITFVGLSTAQNVPGTNLASGAAIGVWLQQSLAANDTAQKNSFTVQLSGQTA